MTCHLSENQHRFLNYLWAMLPEDLSPWFDKDYNPPSMLQEYAMRISFPTLSQEGEEWKGGEVQRSLTKNRCIDAMVKQGRLEEYAQELAYCVTMGLLWSPK